MLSWEVRKARKNSKKPPVPLARGKRAIKNEEHMSDTAINFSDVPKSTDAELKRARRVGRPRTGQAKQLIATR